MSSNDDKGKQSGLSMDRAAFLLLRVKKAFKKKKSSRKDKSPVAAAAAAAIASSAGIAATADGGDAGAKSKPPLLRSRTLPAIIVPGISILQAQIEARYNKGEGSATPPQQKSKSILRLQPPKISFTDDENVSTEWSNKPRLSSPEPRVPSSLRLAVPQSRFFLTAPSSGGGGGGGAAPQPTALYRLSRLLNQRGSTSSASSDARNNNHLSAGDHEKPRRLSWERRDVSLMSCGRLQRSSSIDSVVEAAWGGDSSPSGPLSPSASPCSSHSGPAACRHRAPSPLMMAPPRLLLLSPSVGRRTKFDALNAAERPRTGMELLVDGLALSKVGKKRLDKLNRINIHLHALYGAIENGQVDKARTILESTDIDVNNISNDGLSPLDVAVLFNSRPMTKMLMAFGAQEGGLYETRESLGEHLEKLVRDAEARLQEMATAAPAAEAGNETQGVGGASEKQRALWERRVRGLKKMLLGFEQSRPPDEPSMVAVDVTGTTSVNVRFQEPDFQDISICTKFKLQWSTSSDFSLLAGEKIIKDARAVEEQVTDLLQGRRYFFRVFCGNIFGYGPSRCSVPLSVIPSSWRDSELRKPRYTGRVHALDDLFVQTKSARPESASELRAIENSPGETPIPQRKNQRKSKTIKQLFTAASKFQKNLKRGVYLACLLYFEDRVLVTNEDFLPVIEVDETYPSCIHPDFHWLMKVACTWDDVKSLKQDMEKSLSSSAVHFRVKLLQAASQMQTALSMQDLGHLHPKPLRDSDGTLVLCTVANVRSPKSVSVLNARWLSLSKIQRRLPTAQSTPDEAPAAGDTLMASIPEIIQYNQLSGTKLGRGLYLGYLKLRSSVDLIQILVSNRAPNVLPHCKVRDNPHVCSEEWEWLRSLSARHKKDREDNDEDTEGKTELDNGEEEEPSEQQKAFVRLVAATSKRLLNYMEVSPEDVLSHRLYEAEVIEVSSDVSFIVMVPSAEAVCAVPGTKDKEDPLLRREDLLLLPVQAFEMAHLSTYQRDLMNRYARLSSILETDTTLAQHTHREAFSTAEINSAKERLNKLQELQTRVNATWKGARWIMDLLTFARDRNNLGGVPMKALLPTMLNSPGSNRSTQHNLQPPSHPTGSRGSWPPPPVLLAPRGGEHMSRSEQHLHHSKRDDGLLRTSASSPPAANGALFPPPKSTSPSSGSVSSGSSPGRLPPSRSDDQLHKSRRKSSVPSAMAKLRSSGHSQSDSTLPQQASGRRTSSSASSVSSGSGLLSTPRSSLVPPPAPAAASAASLQSSSAEEDAKSEHDLESDAELSQPIPNAAILQPTDDEDSD
ncbi:ankyrin repeat and fibronectin type-III domain-containing protein 1 isoform X3 [Neocloeon triangulifer]|uniref:ankyrin repeat and fibronectin type-III domain-containing protein 1 isoform X3 n=1 Tax=Neocloeon triangulifer TaxID=2078957 RepID=UPI00286F9373|nr:ankyrin repeat and fibronectin type-III domain-containing protein 1 isoform X3 [Neocloeon triangulifer]